MQNSQIDWEASKENIQPLRRGRNITLLTEALQNPELVEEKKRDFEEELRVYEGDDPLCVWDRYIVWIEEHYPSGLHGFHLPHLLENCISTFMTEKRYNNDQRFVRVWIKFASLQEHPEEVYKCMAARGVGVESSVLYTEWAEFHELSGEPRRAQEILEKGLNVNAQPVEQLRSSLKQLLLRISIGSTKSQEINEDDSDEVDFRSAFSKLQTTARLTAPSIRVGQNRIASHPGIVPNLSKSKSSNSKMAIFVDENAPSGMFSGMGTQSGSSSTAHASSSNKENTRKTSKWTRPKLSQKVTVKEGPTFCVVEDDETRMPMKTPSASICNILSTRRDTTTHMSLSNVLDGPNINEKRMYDFLKVYAGTSEFQFEEIRFARYKRRMVTMKDNQDEISETEASEETTTNYFANLCHPVNTASAEQVSELEGSRHDVDTFHEDNTPGTTLTNEGI